MPLHPDDVVRRTFRTTSLRRGYDENEVDIFLEEVVGELRRLRRQADESEAEIDRLRREGSVGAPAARVAAEERQLEQIRRERDALSHELQDADRRITEANEAVAQAEADRDANLEEIRRRSDEDLSALKLRARDSRDEARRIAEEARLEHDSIVTRLAGLRAESEEAVAAELGEERVAGLIAGLQLADDAGPLADLGIIAGLAEALRRDHVERGRTIAREIRAEAEADRDKMIAEAQRAFNDAVTAASEQAGQMLAEAGEERDRILADVNARRDQLTGEIEELERFQSELRDRISRQIADVVRALEAEGPHA
jgi:DivIVA domain-containing protein